MQGNVSAGTSLSSPTGKGDCSFRALLPHTRRDSPQGNRSGANEQVNPSELLPFVPPATGWAAPRKRRFELGGLIPATRLSLSNYI